MPDSPWSAAGQAEWPPGSGPGTGPHQPPAPGIGQAPVTATGPAQLPGSGPAHAAAPGPAHPAPGDQYAPAAGQAGPPEWPPVQPGTPGAAPGAPVAEWLDNPEPIWPEYEPARRAPSPPLWPRLWREAVAGLSVLFGVIALGVPIGMLWSAVSPRVPVLMTADGPILTSGEPEEYMGSDAVFTLVGLGTGIALGLLCWLVLRRWRGPVVLVALGAGSLLSAVVAWKLGRELGLAEYADLKSTALAGWQFYRPPNLAAQSFVEILGVPVLPRGVLTAQALAAVFTYTLIAGWSRYPGLRRGEEG